VDFPIEENHKLALAAGKDLDDLDDPTRYRRLVGRLIYITIMRPKLSYVVHVLLQFMQNPKEAHMDAARRMLRYLKATPRYGILVRSGSSLQVNDFVTLIEVLVHSCNIRSLAI